MPAGAAGADNFVVGFLTWALYGFANIYYGLSMRVREVLVEQLKTKTSIALTRSMAVEYGAQKIRVNALEPLLGDAGDR